MYKFYSLLGLLLSGCVWPTGIPAAHAESSPLSIRLEALPGRLDPRAVLHSNSPELITRPGILVSTLPWQGAAHLPYAFDGDFGLFLHHVVQYQLTDTPWHVGVVAYNPGTHPVYLTQHWGATALTKPDAPFVPLPALTADPVFAGPGDRITSELLREQGNLAPKAFIIPPQTVTLLYSLDLPDQGPWPFDRRNARSLLSAWKTSGPLHLAVLAQQAETSPPLSSWENLLKQGQLAGARETPPTDYEPTQAPPRGVFRYGRVAGVAVGLHWQGELSPERWPVPGERVGLPISSLYLKRLGTLQNQSADMLHRYPDTARQSHGNYGVRYSLVLRGKNHDAVHRRWQLRLSHPQRAEGSQALFLDPPSAAVRFRGTVRLRHGEDTQDVHLVLQEGQRGEPFATLELAPGEHKQWTLELIYPPDATPPQLLELEGL